MTRKLNHQNVKYFLNRTRLTKHVHIGHIGYYHTNCMETAVVMEISKNQSFSCRFIEFDDFDNLFRNGKTAPPMEGR